MTAAERIMSELDRRSRAVSVERLLSELQIAVERITFTTSSRPAKDISYSDIEQIFEGQLSKSVLEFIHWLRENRLLSVLAGETGRNFLSHCIKRYREFQQVIFKTAVSLPDSTKEIIRQQLTPLYPSTARVLFEVDPEIIAGFFIQDELRIVDKTMRSAAAVLIRKKLSGVVDG